MGQAKMVLLKQFEFSVNADSIFFKTNVEHLDLWLAISKSNFKNNSFEVYAETKVNKELFFQFRARSKANSQIYMVNSSPQEESSLMQKILEKNGQKSTQDSQKNSMT